MRPTFYCLLGATLGLAACGGPVPARDPGNLAPKRGVPVQDPAPWEQARRAAALAGAGEYEEAQEAYKRAGEGCEQHFTRLCGGAVAPRKSAAPGGCARGEALLTCSADACKAAGMPAKARELREVLASGQFAGQGRASSRLRLEAIHKLARYWQRIGEFDRAAQYFERYAEAGAYGGEREATALREAIVLRLLVGQKGAARRAEAAFREEFGRSLPRQTAEVVYLLASHWAAHGAWGEANAQLSARALDLIDRQGTLELRILAHALAGRTLSRLGQTKAARDEYGRAQGLYLHPEQAWSRFEAEGVPARVRGRLLEALGEALFFLAEEEYAAAEQIVFPVYLGPGDINSIKAHIDTKVRQWIEAKRPAIQRASLAYKRVVDLRPEAPPRWVIAAGARVGQLWGRYVEDFRSAPTPDFIARDPGLRTTYENCCCSASEPQMQQAKSAFSTCLRYSAKYQQSDAFSRSCEEWLSGHYRQEYTLVDEFFGLPDRVNRVTQEQSRPLMIGGQPLTVFPMASAPIHRALP